MEPSTAAPKAPSPDHLHWQESLTDGAIVTIRALGPDDAQAERAFVEALSPRSQRNRFFGRIAHPSEAFITQLTCMDEATCVALAAVVPVRGTEMIVGVSRYALDESTGIAECAVVVADAWQDKGLGSRLMRRLIAVARDRGIRKLQSVDLADNTEMRSLAAFLGFETHGDPSDAHLVVHTLDLAPDHVAD